MPKPIVIKDASNELVTTLVIGPHTITIDTEDLSKVQDSSWAPCIKDNSGRVYFQRRYDHMYLHRLLMSCIKGDRQVVDHKDWSTFNNCKSNLRLCSDAENRMNSKKHIDNTSGYKGVSLNRGRWQAQISANGLHFHLGFFSTKEAAYSAYCAASKKHHGEFSRVE